jgi:hypothetical protein
MKRASRWLSATAAVLWLSAGNAAEPAGAVKAVTGSAKRTQTPVTQARSNAQISAASSNDVKVVVDQAKTDAPVADPEYKTVDLADRRISSYELNRRRNPPEARAAAEVPARVGQPAGTSGGAAAEGAPAAKGAQSPARLRERDRSTAPAARCLDPASAKGDCQ